MINIKSILNADLRLKALNQFFCYKSKGTYALVNPLGDKELLEKFIDSDANFENSIILKDSRTTKAGIFKTQNNNIFLKRYNNKGFSFTLRYLFRRARAFRAWDSGFLLKQLNIPTPEPLIAIEYKKGFILEKAFLYTETIENLRTPDEFYQDCIDDKSIFAEFAKTAAEFLYKMHSNNIVHGDYKLHNIYIQKTNEGNFKWGLWDLDSVKKLTILNQFKKEKLVQKDLKRLIRSFNEIKENLNIKEENILDIESLLYEEYNRF